MCGSLDRTIERSALGHPVPDCPPEPFDFVRSRSLPSVAARHPEPAVLTILAGRDLLQELDQLVDLR